MAISDLCPICPCFGDILVESLYFSEYRACDCDRDAYD